jgi:hypothetical protein
VKEKDRNESGELRSLSPELGDAIEGVLAAPNEKLGDGSGPGMGDAMVLEVTAYREWSGKDARTAWYGEMAAGDGEDGPLGGNREVLESMDEWRTFTWGEG